MRRWIAIGGIIVAFVAANLLLAVPELPNFPWSANFVVGLLLSQWFLIAVQFSLGSPHAVVRIPWSFLLAVLLFTVAASVRHLAEFRREYFEWTFLLCPGALAFAVLLWIARWTLGYRIVHASIPIQASTGRQYRSVDLLSVMLMVAIASVLVRTLESTEENSLLKTLPLLFQELRTGRSYGIARAFAVGSALGCLSALPAIWLVFRWRRGRGPIAWSLGWLGYVLMVTFVEAWLTTVITGAPGSGWGGFCLVLLQINGTLGALVVGALAALRAAGYRLVRIPRRNARQTPAPAPPARGISDF